MAVEIPTLRTERLILRAWEAADVVPLHGFLSDQDVMRYFPPSSPPSLERVERLVASQLEHWARFGYGWWAVEVEKGPPLVGWCGLQYLPDTDEIEVAYLLGQAYWGQGWATEGARASLRYGFEELKLERIVAIVHRENQASQRVIQKLGMPLTGPASYFGIDCYHYALARSAYLLGA